MTTWPKSHTKTSNTNNVSIKN